MSAAAPTKPSITARDLATHKKQSDCWISIRGTVYNVTSYADHHPGGVEVLAEVAGSDATERFEYVGHSSEAERALRAFEVGCLEGYVTPRPNVFLDAVAAGGGGSAAPAAVRTGGVSATILRVGTQAGLLLLLLLLVVVVASYILPATVSWSPKPSSSDIVSRLGGLEPSLLRGIGHSDQGWRHTWYYATLGSSISLLTCACLFGWALARFQKLLVRHKDIRA